MGTRRTWPAALASLALIAGCSRTNTVQLEFGDPLQPTGGLGCKDDTGTLIRSRAVDGGVVRFSMVVDFIGLGGVPGCWPSQLIEWCTRDGRQCAALENRRACFDVGPTPLSTNEALLSELRRSLDGGIVTTDAPDEPVLIRLVMTTQSCAEVRDPAVPFSDKSLLGCVISCPVQLDFVKDAVALGLPILTDQCEQSVRACAQPKLGR